MRSDRRVFSVQLFRVSLLVSVLAVFPALAVAGTPFTISSSSGPVRVEPSSADRRPGLQQAIREYLGSADPSKAGVIDLESQNDELSPLTHDCDRIERIACGSFSSDDLTTASCRLDSGHYVEFYDFVGTAGQTVTIDMMSNVFDTRVSLLNPTPTVVADNDDVGSCASGQVGGGCNSQIAFTLTSSGIWSIATWSFPPGVTGPYTLSLQCTGGGGGACSPNATTLCLNNGRYRVTATFLTPQGQSGNAMAVTETSDTGLFWFFSSNNIEAIIKVVNGCTFNQRYWVFAGGLTNVQVILTVTDTQTGTTRTYTNPQNTAFAPIQDTNAFATCP